MTDANKPKAINISKDPPGIEVNWEGGPTQTLSFAFLRRACPCALCKGERLPFDTTPLSLPVQKNLTPLQLEAKDMFSIGTYAIGFRWGDGHDAGIYTYDYLREIAEQLAARS